MQHQALRRAEFGILASAISAALAGMSISETAQAQDGLEEVVVTGSRIVRRDFEANSPIMTVDAQRFEASSTIAMESVINQLPQFVPAINQFDTGGYGQGSGRTPGAATVSLRGLGANRNLVLLDGRRAMPINASMAVSINTIPAAAIERVETITGGASSVYGADAIAGVVNFIVKRDFEGINFDYQYAQTAEGDGDEYRLSGLFGANFAGGNGNVMLGFEYSSREALFARDRDFYTNGWADPSTNGTETFWSDPGFRVDTSNRPSQAAVDAVFNEMPPGSIFINDRFYINQDGTLYKQTPEGAYRYNGPTMRNGEVWRFVQSQDGRLGQNRDYAQVQSPLERYSAYARAHIDLTDNVSGFVHALFTDNDTKAVGSDSPLLGGWRSQAPHGTEIYAPSLDSNGNTLAPYLPGGLYGVNCPAVGGCTNSQVWPTPPELTALLDSRPRPNEPWDFRISSSWAGPRRSDVNTTSYQLTAGFEGEFPNRDWTWEAYTSHGSTRTTGEFGGMTSLQRWRFVTGQPNYGRQMLYTGNELGAGFSAGTAQCTTGFPIVEFFTPSQDCQDAVGAVAKTTGQMDQNILEFNLQGGLVDLPAGEMRFAVGASYRENSFKFVADALNTQGSILDLPAGVFPSANTGGATDTQELYGELLVPLLADKPGFQELNLELGYRDSSNNPSNDVTSYKALIDWRMTDRVRFRGGRQIANRAPNVAELFQSAEQQVLFSPFGDWCSDLNPNNVLSPNPALNPNAAQVQAICEARMGPDAAAAYYDPNFNRSDSAFQWRFSDLYGNPNVLSEEATTMTAGIVVDVTDRVALTLDYWQIEVTDMIAAQSPDVVHTQCFSPETNPTFDPNHPQCLQVKRNPVDGTQSNATVTYTNQGAVDTRGYDIQLDWSGDIGPGTISVNFLATLLDRMATRVDADASWNEWKGSSGPSDLTGINDYAYEYKTFTTLGYRSGNWSASLRWRHLPSLVSQAQLTNPNATFRPTGSYNMFDVAGQFAIADRWQLRYGIDNVLDADPEIAFADARTSGAGQTNESFYDILGRRFYMGFDVDF